MGHDGKLTSDRGTVGAGRNFTPKLSEGNEAEERTYIPVASGLLSLRAHTRDTGAILIQQ